MGSCSSPKERFSQPHYLGKKCVRSLKSSGSREKRAKVMTSSIKREKSAIVEGIANKLSGKNYTKSVDKDLNVAGLKTKLGYAWNFDRKIDSVVTSSIGTKEQYPESVDNSSRFHSEFEKKQQTELDLISNIVNECSNNSVIVGLGDIPFQKVIGLN